AGPGTQHVREVTQAGWRQTTSSVDVVVTSGVTIPSVTIGNFQLITVSGAVFQDNNGNLVRDSGEPGAPGLTVFLDRNNNGFIDANGNGQLDVGEASVVSNGNGDFSFGGLNSGPHRVREVLQPGWITTTPARDIGLTSGGTVSGVSFGNFRVVTLGGRVFADLNAD